MDAVQQRAANAVRMDALRHDRSAAISQAVHEAPARGLEHLRNIVGSGSGADFERLLRDVTSCPWRATSVLAGHVRSTVRKRRACILRGERMTTRELRAVQ
jgi:hypothetical protein